MNYVMVTLLASGQQVDLKLPGLVPVSELLEMLKDTLELPGQREQRLQAEPLGRILDNARSLEEEGVSHGALLTLI
ncbi:EsaB/YukD family protein [Paenibacillus albidus]|uniref:EsaB/YukD family protein n=1 Tax=Paenibacillus albidus TaxID=2041023 RepID=UPI001BE88196|nr:EsaB/YukD family protein [Paenibacillus albidus]MBT2293169.1 EsaB/YukD family protein [Paenibacillus albidus]